MKSPAVTCHAFRRYADALLDAELDPGTQIELERHLAGCGSCQELLALERAVKREVKRSVSETKAPIALRSRIESALLQNAISARSAPPSTALFRVHVLPARYAIPATIASLAAAALLSVMWLNQGKASDAAEEQASTVPMFEDIVRLHSGSLPPDVTSGHGAAVTSYFRGKVDFPVRPAVLGDDAHLTGARLSHVRDHNAAALFYDVGGRRVTVVMFAQPRPQADRVFHGVYVERAFGRTIVHRRIGGYTVSARENEGVTYAFTGDTDEATLVRLTATAHLQ